MKRKVSKTLLYWLLLSAFFLSMDSCSTEQVGFDSIKAADCKYYFINDPIGNCGFDFDKVPYCIDCPDEEGKLGAYNLLIDQPNDSFS